VAGRALVPPLGIEPIYSQCVGVMAGGVLQLAIQVPALRRLGLLPRIGADFAPARRVGRPGVRKILG
jgi:putative peptidoglycan lipid II flippase